MASITPLAFNEKNLANIDLNANITVEEATMTVDEALQPVESLGHHITKGAINTKSLTPISEHT